MAEPEVGTYYCVIHKDVQQQVPGTCPKCEIPLVRQGTRLQNIVYMVAGTILALVLFAVQWRIFK